MARSGVRFSVGGKLTDVGRAVKNVTRRLTRYAQKTGTNVNTKDIRKQVREMVEQGRSEQSIADTLNKIRDNRLNELFVNKKTGEMIGNISNVPLSPLDNLQFYLSYSSEVGSYMDNELLQEWLTYMEREFGEEELISNLQENATLINQALERVVYGYLAKGYTQGLDTALVRLYETIGRPLTWNRAQAISEGVERYEWNMSYGYTDYDGEEF